MAKNDVQIAAIQDTHNQGSRYRSCPLPKAPFAIKDQPSHHQRDRIRGDLRGIGGEQPSTCPEGQYMQ